MAEGLKKGLCVVFSYDTPLTVLRAASAQVVHARLCRHVRLWWYVERNETACSHTCWKSGNKRLLNSAYI